MRSSKGPVQIDTVAGRIFLLESSMSNRALMSLLLPALLAACAQLSISPQPVEPTERLPRTLSRRSRFLQRR
jgi:hypothetical protein